MAALQQCLALLLLCVHDALSLDPSHKDLDFKETDYEGIAKAVNSAKTTWVADTRLANTTNLYSGMKFNGLSSNKYSPEIKLGAAPEADPQAIAELPASFDLRKKYPQCPTIGKIKIQANCGSCWAVATTGALADRMCIATNGRLNHELSIDHLLTCCPDCLMGDGLCDGGYPITAWTYMKKQGVPTGGMYATHVGCKPYPISPCEFPGYGPCRKNIASTLKCAGQTCSNPFFKTPYHENLFFAKSAYKIEPKNTSYPGWNEDVVNMMKYEIYKYGTIVAGMWLYDDFDLYKRGVYQHISGRSQGGHIIKLIGWGEEKGVPYWLGVNSWSKVWGEQGTFKILRGSDECNIETFPVTAGQFDADRSPETVDFVYDITDTHSLPSSSADRQKGLSAVVIGWSIGRFLLHIQDTWSLK